MYWNLEAQAMVRLPNARETGDDGDSNSSHCWEYIEKEEKKWKLAAFDAGGN